METERLYFADAYLQNFSARIVSRRDASGRPEVLLDRSAFYPEGGGQPADWGTLNGVAVSDVQVNDAGEVWHTVARALPDDQVEGVVDWSRRLDHMQQHHGQHLLSAAFENLFGFRTVSFHLGVETATIDISAKDVTPSQISAAEDLTNRVIWEDHPVHARFVSAEELTRIPLRKAPTVSGPIRVVSGGDFDHSACGGTHPRSTGGVGLLHIRKIEKRGNDTRVEFVCGGRALRDLRISSALLGRLAASFTVGPEEIEVAVGRLRETEDRSRKQLQNLGEALAGFEAEKLVHEAPIVGGTPVVRVGYSDRTLEGLRLLAAAIPLRGGTALLGLAGEKAQFIFARAANSTLDCGKLLKETLAEFGGKGGGQPALAQGGVPDSSKMNAVLDAALTRLGSG